MKAKINCYVFEWDPHTRQVLKITFHNRGEYLVNNVLASQLQYVWAYDELRAYQIVKSWLDAGAPRIPDGTFWTLKEGAVPINKIYERRGRGDTDW